MKKLVLSRETLRQLSGQNLRSAQGGASYASVCFSCYETADCKDTMDCSQQCPHFSIGQTYCTPCEI